VIRDKCSVLLYERGDIKPPNDIVLDYDGKCPNCGKKLSFAPINIEVRAIASQDNAHESILIEKRGESRDISPLSSQNSFNSGKCL